MIRTDDLRCAYSFVLTSRRSRRYNHFVMGAPIPRLAGGKVAQRKKENFYPSKRGEGPSREESMDIGLSLLFCEICH